MDTDSFIVYIKTDDIYKEVAEDFEARFENYELEMSLRMNKEVIGLMKGKLGEKIMTGFIGLRAKTYSYLINKGSENKKAKGTKRCVIKRQLTFEDYNNCLEATQIENKINHLEIKKIDVNSLEEDDK